MSGEVRGVYCASCGWLQAVTPGLDAKCEDCAAVSRVRVPEEPTL